MSTELQFHIAYTSKTGGYRKAENKRMEKDILENYPKERSHSNKMRQNKLQGKNHQ